MPFGKGKQEIPWNKGLTKETDLRVLRYSLALLRKPINSEEIRKFRYKLYYQEHKVKMDKASSDHYQKHKNDSDFKSRRIKNYQKWREENEERSKRYRRNYKHQNKERIYTQNKSWNEKHPEVLKAQNLSKGIKIPVGTLCSFCYLRNAVDKHHEDYLKPLDVVFCCKKCHNKLNKSRRLKLER